LGKKYFVILIVFFIYLHQIFAQIPGTVKWSYVIPESGYLTETYCGAAILPDSTIIIDGKGNYCVFNLDGSLKTESFGGCTTPIVSLNDNVYICCSREINSYNLEGIVNWSFRTDGHIYVGPAVDSENTVYIGSGKRFYALKPDGDIKWYFKTNGELTSSPVVGLDGTVYFVTSYEDGKLYALNPDGSEKWVYTLRESYITSPYSSPILDSDGTIYIANSDFQLSAVNPDGTLKWKIRTDHDPYSHFYTTPVIGLDNMIYICTNDDYLYAINRNGNVKWKKQFYDAHKYCPVIGSKGTIYVIAGTALQALNPDGTIKWTFESSHTIHSNPVIAADGTIIFKSYDRVYAIYTQSTGLADSPWPKFGKNNQNQGNNHNLHCPQAKVAQNYISCNLGSVVTLDGSLSSDPDGDLLNYKWRIIKNPAGAEIIFSDSMSSKTNVLIPDNIYSDFLFSLTVDDHQDGSSVAIVKVHVNRIKWTFDTHNETGVYSCPAISSDGIIYFNYLSEVCGLYALNLSGELIFKFSYSYEGPLSSAVLFKENFVIYGEYRYISAINSEERVREWWSESFPGIEVAMEPSVNVDGTIYAGNGNKFRAINQDGTTKWTYESISEMYPTPSAIGINGDIYFTNEQSLIALNPNGTEKWSYYLDGQKNNALSIGPYGTIYVSVSKDLFAINPDGSKQWSVTTYDKIGASAVLDSSGNVYVGSGHYLYSINSDGIFNWSKYFNYSITKEPAIGSDNTIYLANDSTFFAIGEDGSIIWSIKTDGKIVSPIELDVDGVAYFSTKIYSSATDEHFSRIYAIQTDSKGLANSSWPKYRADAENTCRVSPVNNLFSDMDVKDLSVGNKFYYKNYDGNGITKHLIEEIIEYEDSVATIKVKYSESDSVLYRYEKCDGTKLYQKRNDIWQMIFDLNWNVGDTVQDIYVVTLKGKSKIFGESKLYVGYQLDELYYKYYQQFGLVKVSNDIGSGMSYGIQLIGAIIDGIAYGDTANYKNNPPKIVSAPTTEILPDYPYKYIIEIEDEKEDYTWEYPKVSLEEAPNWLELRRETGSRRRWYIKGWTPNQPGIKADVQIKVTDIHGAYTTQSFRIDIIAPTTYNYPNPFNNETIIRYYVPKEGSAIISIFDINGNLVDKIIDSGKKRGQYSITWMPENCQSGLYIYKIVLGAYSKLGKMMLLK